MASKRDRAKKAGARQIKDLGARPKRAGSVKGGGIEPQPFQSARLRSRSIGLSAQG
jgi:hypothetical protein